MPERPYGVERRLSLEVSCCRYFVFYFHQIDSLTIAPHPPTAVLTSFHCAVIVYTIADKPMRNCSLQIHQGGQQMPKIWPHHKKLKRKHWRSRYHTLPMAPSHPSCRDHLLYSYIDQRIGQGGDQKGGGRLPVLPFPVAQNYAKIKNNSCNNQPVGDKSQKKYATILGWAMN